MNTQSQDDLKASVVVQTLARSDPGFDRFSREHSALGDRTLSPGDASELSREILAVLRESPEAAERIELLETSSQPQRFDAGAVSVPALVAILFLLRTHIRLKRRADGRWEFQVEHKPADSKLLTQLLKKLAALLPEVTG